jgi:hypothetical protein
VAGATLRVMDTLSKPPLTDSEQAALRDAALRYLATLSFSPGAPISRGLWLMWVCTEGIRTNAVIPIDDELGLPDPENIAGACKVVATCMSHPEPGERALVVLRRPDAAGISDADEYVFSIMSDAVGPGSAPWAFYVTGPGGVHEVRR